MVMKMITMKILNIVAIIRKMVMIDVAMPLCQVTLMIMMIQFMMMTMMIMMMTMTTNLESKDIVASDLLAWLGEGGAISWLEYICFSNKIGRTQLRRKTHKSEIKVQPLPGFCFSSDFNDWPR